MKGIVVGYGSIGKRHTKNLLSKSKYDILVQSKQNNVNLIDKNRCKHLDSLKQCLDYQPNVGFVTNVSSEHVKTAIQLANANCHLIIEKPLSNSLTDIKKLLNITKKKKLVTFMACNLRFHACIKKIKELISKNEIGKIISVRVECGTYLPEWHPYEDYKKSYASNQKLGGGVVLTCIHEIDYLYWFFGQVKEVFSVTGRYSNLGINADDLSAIILKFKNNIVAEVHLDFFQRPDFRSCKIIGTKGTIYWDSSNNEVKVYDVENKKWIRKLKIKNYDKNKEYVDELLHFLQCVEKKKKTINDLTQGIETLKIALGIINSSKERKIIKIK